MQLQQEFEFIKAGGSAMAAFVTFIVVYPVKLLVPTTSNPMKMNKLQSKSVKL